MNRKIIFFSLVCYAAALLLPPVLLHAAALRAVAEERFDWRAIAARLADDLDRLGTRASDA